MALVLRSLTPTYLNFYKELKKGNHVSFTFFLTQSKYRKCNFSAKLDTFHFQH